MARFVDLATRWWISSGDGYLVPQEANNFFGSYEVGWLGEHEYEDPQGHIYIYRGKKALGL